MFCANFSQNQRQTTPILDSIDGGVVQTTVGFDYNGESDLDLEYAMTLANPISVTLYQAGDLVQGASFNNFLDAIDESYCTFEGGDDPTQDGIYPDPYSTGAGAYQGPENCGGFAATKVISTSYGYNEADLTPFYEQRQCAEYAKVLSYFNLFARCPHTNTCTSSDSKVSLSSIARGIMVLLAMVGSVSIRLQGSTMTEALGASTQGKPE